jgi:catechol 2,3-dioxygenase-like lactoylglutathione lyase family enzyme
MSDQATESLEATASTNDPAEPALKLKFMSHGTLECRDIELTRKFYEEFFGFDVVRTSPISLLIRLGGLHTYAVVQAKKNTTMPFLAHNGIDVETEAEVDECHKITVEQAEKWGLHKVSTPLTQHGTYSFYFWDADENCWEICCNPEGGYTWLFGEGDQDGKGHMDREFDRPESTRK